MKHRDLIAVRPLHDKIFFSLFDSGEKKTRAGIIVIDDDFTERGLRARKALVLASGGWAREIGVLPGQTVLISSLEWTRSFDAPTLTGTKLKVKMTTALPMGDWKQKRGKLSGAKDVTDRVLLILERDKEGRAHLDCLVADGKLPDWAKAL